MWGEQTEVAYRDKSSENLVFAYNLARNFALQVTKKLLVKLI